MYQSRLSTSQIVARELFLTKGRSKAPKSLSSFIRSVKKEDDTHTLAFGSDSSINQAGAIKNKNKIIC